MPSSKIFFNLLALLLLFGALQIQADETQGKTNAEIRQWYNQQVSVVPRLNKQWQKASLSAKQRAHKAYEIRHQARVQARAMMQNKDEVRMLQARDQQKYGNPDGPTFDYLVEKNRTQGLSGDDIYEAIIDSSRRTNKNYNKKYGVNKIQNHE